MTRNGKNSRAEASAKKPEDHWKHQTWGLDEGRSKSNRLGTRKNGLDSGGAHRSVTSRQEKSAAAVAKAAGRLPKWEATIKSDAVAASWLGVLRTTLSSSHEDKGKKKKPMDGIAPRKKIRDPSLEVRRR